MEKVKLSKDEKHIEFQRLDTVPTTPKRFRSCDELEELYRFVYENDLRRHAFSIVNAVHLERKAKKGKK